METKRFIGSGTCPFCGEDNRVSVTEKEMTGIEKWRGPMSGGPNIQEVMPLLSPAKREILISGMCLSCQKEMFGNGE